MRGELLIGVLSLFPAAALWLSWPRRAWASWACAGGAGLLWLGGMAAIDAGLRMQLAAAGAASLAACFYAGYVASRSAAEYARIDAGFAKRKSTRDELKGGLAAAKARAKDIETEQREVLALYGMVKGMAEAMTWTDIRPKLEVAVEQYLRVDEFAVYALEQRGQESLRLLARRRLQSSVGGSWETLSRWLQENGVPLTVPRVLEKPERAVALPVFDGEKLMGYFYARIPQGIDAETLLTKAQNFVDEISFAFRRIKLFHEVEKFSQVDGLTGTFRRGVLDERIAEEVVRAQTFKTTFCLMLLDIDKFKSLNDTYGHQFGDEVLRRVGELLRGSVYETDFVARYGGEEFAILLPRAEPAGVLRKAETVRKAIEDASFELAMQRVKVTVSLGIAHFPRDGQTADALVRQADVALYHAKENGRNRVIDVAEIRRPP
ncbi:MAG: GGDEF domain-containing protein [Elusimicrobia bacterium]|nr:GGDEF domain-containing protein [Elusimicrobiota bacterium]